MIADSYLNKTLRIAVYAFCGKVAVDAGYFVYAVAMSILHKAVG